MANNGSKIATFDLIFLVALASKLVGVSFAEYLYYS